MSQFSTDATGPSPVLAWVFDPGDAPWLNRVLTTTDQYMALLREVGNEVLPNSGLRWAVESLSMSSPLQVQVRPDAPAATRADLEKLADAVNGGMRAVQATSERPRYFTDAALLIARNLAKETVLGGSRMWFGDARRRVEQVEVTVELIAHVDAILGEQLTAIGTVEGRLEGFNVHGSSRYFSVYDALTAERIRCDFGYRISVDEIGAAAERRVAVHGEIVYRESGEIVRVVAHSLEVFPREDELPSADDVLGIIEG